MALRLGATAISTLRLGTATPSKVMLGTTEVWPLAPVGDPWTPADMAAIVWLDASDGVQVVNGNQVSQWNNKATAGTAQRFGNGTQGNVSRQLLYTTPTAGVNAVRVNNTAVWNAGLEFTQFGAMSSINNFGIFAMTFDATNVGAVAGTLFAVSYAGEPAWLTEIVSFRQPGVIGFIVDFGTDGLASANYSVVGHRSYVQVYDGRLAPAARAAFRLNGATISPNSDPVLASSAPPTATAATFGFAQHYLNDPTWGMTCDVTQFVMAPLADMTSANIERLEGWAHHKYGIADLLPANHPYKNAPPAK